MAKAGSGRRSSCRMRWVETGCCGVRLVLLVVHPTHWFLVGVEEDDVLLQISGCHTHCTHLHCQLRVGHTRVTWQSRCIDYVITGDHHMITIFCVFLQRPKHKQCKKNQLACFAHLKWQDVYPRTVYGALRLLAQCNKRYLASSSTHWVKDSRSGQPLQNVGQRCREEECLSRSKTAGCSSEYI